VNFPFKGTPARAPKATARTWHKEAQRPGQRGRQRRPGRGSLNAAGLWPRSPQTEDPTIPAQPKRFNRQHSAKGGRPAACSLWRAGRPHRSPFQSQRPAPPFPTSVSTASGCGARSACFWLAERLPRQPHTAAVAFVFPIQPQQPASSPGPKGRGFFLSRAAVRRDSQARGFRGRQRIKPDHGEGGPTLLPRLLSYHSERSVRVARLRGVDCMAGTTLCPERRTPSEAAADADRLVRVPFAAHFSKESRSGQGAHELAPVPPRPKCPKRHSRRFAFDQEPLPLQGSHSYTGGLSSAHLGITGQSEVIPVVMRDVGIGQREFSMCGPQQHHFIRL
jgi:hypothetical protein